MQVEMRVDTAQANPMVDMYEDDKFEFLPKQLFKVKSEQRVRDGNELS